MGVGCACGFYRSAAEDPSRRRTVAYVADEAKQIGVSELRYGCAKRGAERLTRSVDLLLSEIKVMPFEMPADGDYGRLRAALEAAGRPIGGNDMLIADTPSRAAPRSSRRIPMSTIGSPMSVENWLA